MAECLYCGKHAKRFCLIPVEENYAKNDGLEDQKTTSRTGPSESTTVSA